MRPSGSFSKASLEDVGFWLDSADFVPCNKVVSCLRYTARQRPRHQLRSVSSLEIKLMQWVRKLLMLMFGRPKGVMGRLGGVIMARVNRDAAAQVIDLLDVQPDDRILEVVFGPGVAVQLLLHRMPTVWVAGVDQSQEMVRQAAARNAEAARGRRVDLRYGSAERLPFGDETFDKVLAINSMQAWTDAGAGLREIRRVLKPGGNVVLGFTVNSGQPKAGVAESLAAAGFAQARIVDRPKLFCAIASKPTEPVGRETRGRGD
jgi:SAM-dependent methyltransferase